MENRRLRALIVRLQDRLTEDDRRRLHFFLGDDIPRRIRDDPSLGGTLNLMESLFDQDKINSNDFTFLTNAFDEIQCLDAVKFLKEHMKHIQSNGLNESVQSLSILMPPLLNQVIEDQVEDKISILIPMIKKDTNTNNNDVTINSQNNNTINTNNVKNHKQMKIFSPEKQKNILFIRHKYFIFIFLLLIIETGLIISGYIWFKNLENQVDYNLDEQIKNNDQVNLYVKNFSLFYNEELIKLHKLIQGHSKTSQINEFPEDWKYAEGKICTCAEWCKQQGEPYGMCTNGHSCHCGQRPITKAMIGNACICEGWCQRHNHTDGICGDGYTCICSK